MPLTVGPDLAPDICYDGFEPPCNTDMMIIPFPKPADIQVAFRKPNYTLVGETKPGGPFMNNLAHSFSPTKPSQNRGYIPLGHPSRRKWLHRYFWKWLQMAISCQSQKSTTFRARQGGQILGQSQYLSCSRTTPSPHAWRLDGALQRIQSPSSPPGCPETGPGTDWLG
jgi:hypothetical protein